MSMITIIIIAFALSMDAFVVSIASGVIIKKNKLHNAFKFGFTFGFFQMIMPLIGWSGGYTFQHVIAKIDHWVAFGLLSFIGGKMIYEAFEFDVLEKNKKKSFTFYILLGLAIATSIDALAVGVSFACLKVAIVLPSIIIGIITFLMSYIGILIGHKFGHIFEQKIEIIGGLVLIGIGIKILLEQLL